MGLRSAAILLIVTLLFRPVLSYQKSPAEKPAIVFLLDTSASMSIADDATGTPRFNQARDKLTKWCEKLKDDFRLRLIAFAEQAEPLDGPESLPALTPTGKRPRSRGRCRRHRSNSLRPKSPRSSCFPTASTTRQAIRSKPLERRA